MAWVTVEAEVTQRLDATGGAGRAWGSVVGLQVRRRPQREGSGCLAISLGPQNKVPQSLWLNTTDVSSLSVLEARSVKSRCGQGHLLSKGSRGGSLLASSNFWRLPAILGIPGLVARLLPSLSSLRGLLPLCVSVCPLLL